ncbi:uncharacterized serine-rich protein C215.13-like [Euphorbia lathyris]|uniref:uncharacterized serine-rich protein C215.13-like n=1 Tax=Euphorbia lathyris TaxID=212925 RepID=UPI00331396AE
MDSGNSGSMQSSSGGDEEYDSRPPPPFLNPNFGHLSNHLSLLPNQDHSLFDPNNSHNFFHSFSSPNLNTSLLNLDLPGTTRPLDCTKPSGNAQGGPVSSMHLGSNGVRSSSPSDQVQVAARNPKKRTRASRRAPTTVLTTDTSNFRAMVQEFTGIPAPPFSGSPYTRRFDLFGSGMRSEPVASSSLYHPLRPSAQKVHQQSPFLFSSSSSSSSLMMSNNSSSTNSSTSNPVTTSNFNSSYQLVPSEPQNLLNMQNQMLSFQSLLPSSSSHLHTSLNAKSLLPFEEMGMGHGQINPNLNSWRDHQGSHIKLNSSSDFHHENKGLENVPPRGEGTTVDSWICPSD